MGKAAVEEKAPAGKPGADSALGTSKADLKAALKHAAAKPVPCAFATGRDGKMVLLMDHHTPAVKLLVKLKDAPGTKDHRFGTVSVDPKQPKVVRFKVNRSSTGMAGKLIKALKGTGINHIELGSDDGEPPESHHEEDEEEEKEAEGGKPDGKPDTGALVAKLTPLVRKALDVGAKNPAEKAALQKLATTAQTNLRSAMLSLKPEALKQVETDIKALEEAVEKAAEADDAKAQPEKAGPDAQQITARLTDLAKQAATAMAADAENGKGIKTALDDARNALKGGDLAAAGKLTDKLETALKDAAKAGAARAQADQAQVAATLTEAAKKAMPLIQAAGAGADAIKEALNNARDALKTGDIGKAKQHTATLQKLVDGAGSAKSPKAALLEKAPEVVTTTVGSIHADLAKLKDTVLKAFAKEDRKIVDAVASDMQELDRIAKGFDHSLAHALKEAGSASDPTAHAKAKDKAKAEVKRMLDLVKNEPLIAHIDNNPFGIQTKIATKMSEMARHVLEVMK